MIKEIDRNNKIDWFERIRVEMNLSDLQILYDCIGAVPIKYLKKKHKNTSFNSMEFTFDNFVNDLYCELGKILSEYNGVTDDDISEYDIAQLDIIEEGN